MKSNYKISCHYCGNPIDRINTKRRLFCCDICCKKYWKGVYKRLWKEGKQIVNPDDKPQNQSKKEVKKT